MNTLKIFGDESGTMPVADFDDAFTVAMVAILGNYPSFDFRGNSDDDERFIRWLVPELQGFACDLYVGYVKPQAGYGRAFQQKMQKMKAMTRVNQLIGRATDYIRKDPAKDPFNERDYIWGVCMENSLASIIISAFIPVKNKVDQVEIFLDRKSLSQEAYKLFDDGIKKRLRNKADSILSQRQQAFPQLANRLDASRDRLSIISISLNWSHEPAATSAKDGLRFAHHLAKQAMKELQGGSSIKQHLVNAGFKDSFIDFTPVIIAPLSTETVSTWEGGTGLREPM